MDYFYAQVEIRDRPELKGKPVAIGGLHNGRGVLCTSNYIARKYGVRSAMSTVVALKKCPQLVLIPPCFEKYKKVSDEVFEIFKQFSNVIQKISLDEAYLDVTDCKKFQNNATEIAKEIKRRIFGKTGLTASAGVSYNKFLAKIGSELKKPNGLVVLRPEGIKDKIGCFPVSRINGVGKVTLKKMNSYGIIKFEDLYKFSKLDLLNMFGDFGADLYFYCRGVDERIVEGNSERKTLSVENTFFEDLDNDEELILKLEGCYQEMLERLKKYQHRLIKTIFVKIKYSDFKSVTIEMGTIPTFEYYKELFFKKWDSEKPIRLLGTGVKFYSSELRGQLFLPLKLD